MAPSIKLSIVFLNFNKLSETEQTCNILKTLCEARNDIEIIAVDNGSEDGTAEYLQTQPHITSIFLPDNTGIAGYNQGFKNARGQYILVLDDDSSPENLTCIDQSLLRLDEHSEIGIIAAHIQSPNGSPQWSWHLPEKKLFSPSPFFIGCGFIIRRDLLLKIGGYPDDFFLYQNEIEVGFQARLEGYEIYYDPDCVIIHRGIPSQRPGWRRVFFPTQNTLWLIRQYYPQPIASYMLFSRLIIGLIRAISFNQVLPYFKAVKKGLLCPVKNNILPLSIRNQCAPFFKQNSIIHQLLRKA